MSQHQDIFDDFNVDVFEDLSRRQENQPIVQNLPSQPMLQENQIMTNRSTGGSARDIRREDQSQSVQAPPSALTNNHSKQKSHKKMSHYNKFSLTDEQKINLSKRLPKGFVLLKKGDYPETKQPFKGQIEYIPIKKQPKIASQELLQKFPLAIISAVNPKREVQKRIDKPGLRLSIGSLPQGKSKQTQKVKGVLQKFRKHPKYPILAQQLNKIGFMQGFSQIQSQIKKNIHTIDSFKDRCLYIMNQAKLATFAQSTIQVINQLIDQFMFQIQQAKKLQFQNNLIMIQKNIDKITRQITDIRESGNWYLRKKKRTQKNFDQKQVMYIADLVRELPPAYLVGVWEIVEERPFLQSQEQELEINFSQLKTKKIRQIQSYVKRKLNTYFTSRQRKREKIRRKIEQIKNGARSQNIDEQNVKNQENQDLQKIDEQKPVSKSQISQNKPQQKPNSSQILQKQNILNNEVQNYISVEPVTEKTNIKPKSTEKFDENPIDQFLELDQLYDHNVHGKMNDIEEESILAVIGENPVEPESQAMEGEGKKVKSSQKVGLQGNVQENKEMNQQNRQNQAQQNEQKLEQHLQQQKQQFELQQPDYLRIPQPLQGDSSDSSFITDDQDSDY